MNPALASIIYTVVGGVAGGLLAWFGIAIGERIMDRKK